MRIGSKTLKIMQISIVKGLSLVSSFLLLKVLFPSPLLAADLKPLFALSDARVLPKGVRRLSYKNMLLSANQKFGNAGQSLVLADPLFKRITFDNILLGIKKPAERGALEQVMMSMGASGSDDFGMTTGQVNVNSSTHVPILAWGLSEKWTLAMALPIVQASINVDSGVIQENPSMHSSMIRTLNQKGVTEKIVEFQEKMSDPVRSKLRDYGYSELAGERVTLVGDLKVVSKYRLVNNQHSRLGLLGELTLPVGHQRDIDKVINVTLADGQTDVGVGIHYDYLVSSSLTMVMGASYTLQLPDRNRERVPEQRDSRVTPDIDPDLRRDLGDILSAQIGGMYASKGWSLQVGHSYQYKGADDYSGTRFAPERYSWMSQETEQEMHSLVLGGGYSTVDLFKAKKFPLPMMISLNHTRVLAGKNVVNNPLTSLDVSLFF